MTSPFLIYVDAVVHLLADRGADRLSVREIARWMGVTPAAVLQQHSKAAIMEIVVARFSWRWLQWSQPRRGTGLPATLPATPEECHGVLVWHALAEIARGAACSGDVAPQAQLERTRRDEHEQVASTLSRLLDRRPSENETVGVVALVSGLRAEIVAPGAVVTSDAAAEILRGHVELLRRAPTPQPAVRSA